VGEAESPLRTDGGPAEVARPWSSSWVSYYDQASRRRHRMGGYRRLRALARRKKRLEAIVVASAAAAVLALVSVFYFILDR